jgi:hypothetical protein
MATIEEEAAKRMALAKKLNPWMAIDYLESVVEMQAAEIAALKSRIAELERELTNWPIEYENERTR